MKIFWKLFLFLLFTLAVYSFGSEIDDLLIGKLEKVNRLKEEGSFVVIPGSHKSNFDNPFSGSIPDENHPLIETCPCKAGDAVLFSEDLTHGALINQSNKTRRTFFISYAPAFQTPWGKLVDTAEGFEERASPGQLELIKGPSPFAIAES